MQYKFWILDSSFGRFYGQILKIHWSFKVLEEVRFFCPKSRRHDDDVNKTWSWWSKMSLKPCSLYQNDLYWELSDRFKDEEDWMTEWLEATDEEATDR